MKIDPKWWFSLSNMKLTIRFVHFVVQFFVLEHSLEVPSCYLFNWSLFHSQIRLPVFFTFRTGFFFSNQFQFSVNFCSLYRSANFCGHNWINRTIFIYALIRLVLYKNRYNVLRIVVRAYWWRLTETGMSISCI